MINSTFLTALIFSLNVQSLSIPRLSARALQQPDLLGGLLGNSRNPTSAVERKNSQGDITNILNPLTTQTLGGLTDASENSGSLLGPILNNGGLLGTVTDPCDGSLASVTNPGLTDGRRDCKKNGDNSSGNGGYSPITTHPIKNPNEYQPITTQPIKNPNEYQPITTQPIKNPNEYQPITTQPIKNPNDYQPITTHPVTQPPNNYSPNTY